MGATLRYAYEVRNAAEFFDDLPAVKIAPDMLKLAEHILASKKADFDPSEFVDHYEEAVVEMLRKKQAGTAVPKGRAAPPARSVVNLIDALKRSIAAEKKAPRSKKRIPGQGEMLLPITGRKTRKRLSQLLVLARGERPANERAAQGRQLFSARRAGTNAMSEQDLAKFGLRPGTFATPLREAQPELTPLDLVGRGGPSRLCDGEVEFSAACRRAAKGSHMQLQTENIIDLSLELDPKNFAMRTPSGFKKDMQFEMEVIKEHDAPGGAGQIVRGVHMRLHAGSHVDAPEHNVSGGTQIHQLPLTLFIGDAIVADLRDKVPGKAITEHDLANRLDNRVRKGDRVLLRTDQNNAYDGGSETWMKNSPYLTIGATRWLIDKGAVIVGYDSITAMTSRTHRGFFIIRAHSASTASSPCPI